MQLRVLLDVTCIELNNFPYLGKIHKRWRRSGCLKQRPCMSLHMSRQTPTQYHLPFEEKYAVRWGIITVLNFTPQLSAMELRFQWGYSEQKVITYGKIMALWSYMSLGPASFKVRLLLHMKAKKKSVKDMHGNAFKLRFQWDYTHLKVIKYERVIVLWSF